MPISINIVSPSRASLARPVLTRRGMAITSYFFLLAKGRYSTICRSTGWLTEYARLLFFFMQCRASRRKHAAGASSGGYSYTVLSHVGGAPSFSASRARARARPNTAEGRYGRGGVCLKNPSQCFAAQPRNAQLE